MDESRPCFILPQLYCSVQYNTITCSVLLPYNQPILRQFKHSLMITTCSGLELIAKMNLIRFSAANGSFCMFVPFPFSVMKIYL